MVLQYQADEYCLILSLYVCLLVSAFVFILRL